MEGNSAAILGYLTDMYAVHYAATDSTFERNFFLIIQGYLHIESFQM